jgi:hypothetical protein
MSQAHTGIEIPKLPRSIALRTAALLLSLLAASAAWGQKIDVQFDASVDFSKYKTFAVRNGSLNSRNPALNGELVQKQIEADIRNDLTARGLTERLCCSSPTISTNFGSARGCSSSGAARS